MIIHPGRPEISLDDAREAQRIVRDMGVVGGYANGIGIGRDNGAYCVTVNLERQPPAYVFSGFPKEVRIHGGELVGIRYRVVGSVKATA